MASPSIPAYFSSNPAVWFMQLESYFELQKTDINSKYHHLISRLPEDIAVRVLDPNIKDYTTLLNC